MAEKDAEGKREPCLSPLRTLTTEVRYELRTSSHLQATSALQYIGLVSISRLLWNLESTDGIQKFFKCPRTHDISLNGFLKVIILIGGINKATIPKGGMWIIHRLWETSSPITSAQMAMANHYVHEINWQEHSAYHQGTSASKLGLDVLR